LLVPVRDAQALADALEELIADAEQRQTMGKAGRKLVETHYSEAQFIARSLALYEEVAP
ncbi:MAG TPA: glycosyltransferase family 1 protein, partial [Alphaproteobacteria bacterium]|nr:glycosyltransferase family 1 protein [Alphaproteobacteria bacterium]